MKHLLTWVVVLLATGQTLAGTTSAVCGLSVKEQQVITTNVTTHLQALLSEASTEPTQVVLEPMGPWPELQAVQVTMPSSLRSRVPVTLTGLSCRHGRHVKETQWYSVRALREAWVYGRPSVADRDVMDAAPRRAEIDLAALQLLPSELVDDLQGLWLRRSVHTGQPILRQHVRIEPLVRRDAAVNVVVQSSGLMLRARGRALQHGAMGEQVSVLVNGAEGSIPAVVTGKGEVHAQM
ncbi:MAG: flagellar basal body P-ring formation chaperone FlgA [Moraxellaceae bacterium]|nr:flagellar basal body P-ring formation chaperone FlgA [Moraxellaceae bacterium]MDZ4385690.1 flagellar basal body P-ring formation chaperone FlgA [Moraxellaceae bacterium]